jgi:Zn-dependent protease with chaperone function
MFFRYITLPRIGPDRATRWMKHRRSNRVFSLIAVVGWCALWELPLFAVLPPMIFWIAPILNAAALEGASRFADSAILRRTWTAADVLRLAFWSAAAPPISLLVLAAGFHAIFDGVWIGALWICGAGVVAIIGPMQLRYAQGIKLRRVKSGRLYTRAFRLARKVGVNLQRVYVIPPGRGHLTNAFGLWRGIALTDNFGEYLSGPELDFVIGHELAHVQGGHTRKQFSVVLLLFSILLLLSFRLSSATASFRALFILLALLAPLLTIYSISRYFEYSSDREAVAFTNDPEAGMRALANLYRTTGSPTKCNRLVELFMTHPSLVHRLEAIARSADIPAARATAVLAEAGMRGARQGGSPSLQERIPP